MFSMARIKPLAVAAIVIVAVIGSSDRAAAQSDVFTDPFEIEFGKGTWGLLLPSYNLGTGTDGAAFQDDLDNPGFIFQLKAIRRFLGTRTSMEARTWYALAGANSLSSEGDFEFLNPASGAAQSLTGGRGQISTDTDHYGGEFLLRDTWRSRFGGLSAGVAFTYMGFDQDFQAEFNGVRQFNETLESDFTGGKGFVGWDGKVLGYASRVDLLFGYFDVDSRYEFDGQALSGTRNLSGGGNSGTVEINASTRRFLNIGEVGFSVNAMLITDMPSLVQNEGPVTIGSEEAATISFVIEWVF